LKYSRLNQAKSRMICRVCMQSIDPVNPIQRSTGTFLNVRSSFYTYKYCRPRRISCTDVFNNLPLAQAVKQAFKKTQY